MGSCDIFVERNISGRAFASLTREDFALIYPGNEKFLLGSNLFKLAQKFGVGDRVNTQSLLDEMSELEDDRLSHHSLSSSHASTSSASRTSTPCPPSSSGRGSNESSFKLPIFSPDLKQCIRKDEFYTASQRNKLIKEACMALRGYCWERENTVSNADKRCLARKLLELAPRSLGDPGSGYRSAPEVSSLRSIFVYLLMYPCLSLIG